VTLSVVNIFLATIWPVQALPPLKSLRSRWKHNVLDFDSIISIFLTDDLSQTEVEDEDRAALDLQEYISSLYGD
jgi:hypothetical protein